MREVVTQLKEMGKGRRMEKGREEEEGREKLKEGG